MLSDCQPSIFLMAAVVFTALQAMQQTCRLFHELLANPSTTTTWGRLELAASRAGSRSDVVQLSTWVQRRLSGELQCMHVFGGPCDLLHQHDIEATG